MKQIKTYNKLEKLFAQGVKKVHIEYNKEHWGISEDELKAEVHTIEPNEDGILDLFDSQNRAIGCVDTCMRDKMIFVYELEETDNE